MQQSKKRKKSRFLDFEKRKKRKSKDLETTQSVFVYYIRPYFNQKFYIMLYV